MSAVVQLLRGSVADNDGLTEDIGLLTADTEKRNLRLHDGTTAGGFRVAGQVHVNRVTTGTSYTLTIKGAEELVVWTSATSGAKTTHLPAAGAANDGCKVIVATTLANGDTHHIVAASGTVQGGSTFDFTDDPRAAVTLISDGAGTDWIIT